MIERERYYLAGDGGDMVEADGYGWDIMQVPVFNIDKAGNGLVVGIIIRAFDDILALFGKRDDRTCTAIFAC